MIKFAYKMGQFERKERIIPRKAEVLGSVTAAFGILAGWGCSSSKQVLPTVTPVVGNVGGALSAGPNPGYVEHSNGSSQVEGSVDVKIKNSEGTVVDINQDPKFRGKPVLVFYYGEGTGGASDPDVEILTDAQKINLRGIPVMPVVVTNLSFVVDKLRAAFGSDVYIQGDIGREKASLDPLSSLRFQGYPATVILDRDHKPVFHHDGKLGDVEVAQINDTIATLESK